MRAAGMAFVALVACAPGAAAQNTVFNRTGSGARAAGMANAFIAVSDDGTATSWNPAGLAQLRMPELSLVSSTAGQSSKASGFRTLDDSAIFTPVESSFHTTYLDFASLAVPATLFKRPVTFQAAWHRLYTLDFRENAETLRLPTTPEGPPALQVVSNADTTGGVDLVSFAAAVKLTPRLALGGSFNLWRGDWTDTVSWSQTVVDGGQPSDFNTITQSNRLRGESLNLGLLLTYPRWSVGLQYQGQMGGDIRVDTTGQHSGMPPDPPVSGSGRADFPQGFALGTAFRPTQSWTVALDLTWDQWTDTTVTINDQPPISIFDGLPPALSGTRDTLSAHAGAERLFHGEGFVVPVRFGVAYEPQGPRSAYTREGADYVMLAAGAGYNTNSLKFDAAVQYRRAGFMDGSDFGVGQPNDLLPVAVGERNLREWRVKFSVIVRVTDTEKMRGAVKKMFGG
jgi:long-subunit fatty acid transport protein